MIFDIFEEIPGPEHHKQVTKQIQVFLSSKQQMIYVKDSKMAQFNMKIWI